MWFYYGVSLKNLILFFFGGRGYTNWKCGGGGGGWSVFRFKGGGEPVKKRGGVLSLPFWETECMWRHYQTVDSQANINFSENGCITAEIPQKRLSNEWIQTEDLRKQEGIWKNSNWVETDVSGQSLSRNKFLVIIMLHRSRFQSFLVLSNFTWFFYFEIFCPGW